MYNKLITKRIYPRAKVFNMLIWKYLSKTDARKLYRRKTNIWIKTFVSCPFPTSNFHVSKRKTSTSAKEHLQRHQGTNYVPLYKVCIERFLFCFLHCFLSANTLFFSHYSSLLDLSKYTNISYSTKTDYSIAIGNQLDLHRQATLYLSLNIQYNFRKTISDLWSI